MSTKRQSLKAEPVSEGEPVQVPSETDSVVPAPADPVDAEWVVLEDSEPIPHGGQMMTLPKGTTVGERRYGAALIERWQRVYGLKLKRTAG